MRNKRTRIFWLGMHKILRPTELNQLRTMGYEVFSPEYISPVYDQSADLAEQRDQATSLPANVFSKLIDYDFFYRAVDPEIAELLNEYFDIIIVTINPDWLIAVLDCFRGPVIYRTYGQPYSLSHHFIANGYWEKLIARPDFHIVPFAAESLQGEDRWFRDLCTEPVGYQIPDDVFDATLPRGKAVRQEIAVSIPNISNPYYGRVYHEFVSNYRDPFFRIYGPQRDMPADPRVMGQIERSGYLEQLQRSAGYLYVYHDNVCYLPPIEAMQLGRPVVFLPGSLLARFNHVDNPGAASSAEHARTLCKRLVNGDHGLVREIVAAQEPVRLRYDRREVRPQFERVMRKLLAHPQRGASVIHANDRIISTHAAPSHSETVVIPLHIDGLFHYINGQPTALEGIPRVVEALVDVLISRSTAQIVLSCTHGSRAVMYDFFRAYIDSGRLTLFPFSEKSIRSSAALNFEKLRFVDHLSSIKDSTKSILIPHYYLFPEMALIEASLTLYLPDYFPHLMPDAVFDVSAEKDQLNKQIGRMLARKADRILTNSQFTKNYLPATGLVEAEDQEKIIVAPLPFLGAKRAGEISPELRKQLEERLRGRQFLFYPTANRPNKKLVFFLRLLASVRLNRPNLCAVLTCDLNSVAEVAEAARNYGLEDALIMLPGSSEDMMRWLYEHAAALCLTSIAEGNFPPQVLEALNYGTPVVATCLPTIEEIARQDIDKLLLCPPLDLTSFIEALDVALSQRETVLARQAALLKSLNNWNSPDAFAKAVSSSLPGVSFSSSSVAARRSAN